MNRISHPNNPRTPHKNSNSKLSPDTTNVSPKKNNRKRGYMPFPKDDSQEDPTQNTDFADITLPPDTLPDTMNSEQPSPPSNNNSQRSNNNNNNNR